MEGSVEYKILKDKWTAVSVDDKRSVFYPRFARLDHLLG